jgi:hypothetical protein
MAPTSALTSTPVSTSTNRFIDIIIPSDQDVFHIEYLDIIATVCQATDKLPAGILCVREGTDPTIYQLSTGSYRRDSDEHWVSNGKTFNWFIGGGNGDTLHIPIKLRHIYNLAKIAPEIGSMEVIIGLNTRYSFEWSPVIMDDNSKMYQLVVRILNPNGAPMIIRKTTAGSKRFPFKSDIKMLARPGISIEIYCSE